MHQLDWIGKWTGIRADQLAVKDADSGHELTYQDLHHWAERLAGYWWSTGLRKGDRCLILSENRLEHLVLFAAAQKSGVVLVPLNYRLSQSELKELVERSEAKMLILDQQFAPETFTGLVEIIESWSVVAEVRNMTNTWPTEYRNHDWNDPIFILYTSGTTGLPKGVLYTHSMLFWNSINTLLALDYGAESRTLNCMPFFHTGGWNVLVTPFLHQGATVILKNKFEPGDILETLEKEKIDIFMAVPTMMQMMADEAAFDQTYLEHLKYILVGGEAMSIPLIEKWQKKGVPIRQGYGMTEVGPNLTSLPESHSMKKRGSIGLPNFYVQLKLMDEDGRERPTGPGEIWLKGPMVTPGYFRDEKSTQSAFHEGWFRTGDRAYRDEDGFFYIVDRIKNMFISGGENIYPAEIERVLRDYPAIEEVVVVPVPHPKWGEVGMAFYTLSADALEKESLEKWMANKLAKFKQPKYWILRDTLPLNDTGKVDRQALGRQALRELEK